MSVIENPPNLIVIGGGQFARVIIDAANESGVWNVIGFTDPSTCEETVGMTGIKHLGTDDQINSYPDAYLVLGIGCSVVTPDRKKIINTIGQDQRWARVLHPAAYVSQMARIKSGAVILAGAVVCPGATIGHHSIINLGAKIDHDVSVGDYVHVSPQAALGGGSQVGRGSYVGMGAIVRDHCSIGSETMIGMGAVVTKNFGSNCTVMGIPAKQRAA